MKLKSKRGRRTNSSLVARMWVAHPRWGSTTRNRLTILARRSRSWRARLARGRLKKIASSLWWECKWATRCRFQMKTQPQISSCSSRVMLAQQIHQLRNQRTPMELLKTTTAHLPISNHKPATCEALFNRSKARFYWRTRSKGLPQPNQNHSQCLLNSRSQHRCPYRQRRLPEHDLR